MVHRTNDDVKNTESLGSEEASAQHLVIASK